MHKRIAAMQQHRFQTGSATPIFVSSSRSKKSKQHEKQETSTTMNLIRNYRNWRRYRETVSELSRLTNRELNDLGIARGDIPFVARKAI
jgi:uncharacterized protein YjiS (DUF1127 family)